jgi:cholinesterase
MVALLPIKIPQFATAGTAFNPELAKIPAEELAKHPDIRIANSDWGPYFDEVITHLDRYGLTDATLTCGDRTVRAQNPGPCASATHFYYFAAHPSTATHHAIGDMLYTESLTKAP